MINLNESLDKLVVFKITEDALISYEFEEYLSNNRVGLLPVTPRVLSVDDVDTSGNYSISSITEDYVGISFSNIVGVYQLTHSEFIDGYNIYAESYLANQLSKYGARIIDD